MASLAGVLSLAVLAAGSLLLPGGRHPHPPRPTPPVDHGFHSGAGGGKGNTPNPPVNASRTSTASTYSEISGTITQAATGAPYPGATVEFGDLSHNWLTAKTDESGHYAIRLPAGIWTVQAEDLSNLGNESDLKTSFQIAGGGNDSIILPPSTTVDFVASPTGV